MKAKGVRLHAANDLRLEEFELPEITDDEILVKVVSDSICMSTYKCAILGTAHKRVHDDVAEHDGMVAGLLAGNKAAEALEAASGGTICGIAAAAITATIAGMRGLDGREGDHATSADMNGDRRDFVSYRTVLWEE